MEMFLPGLDSLVFRIKDFLVNRNCPLTSSSKVLKNIFTWISINIRTILNFSQSFGNHRSSKTERNLDLVLKFFFLKETV